MTDFLKVRFHHNQLEKPQFGQFTQLQAWGLLDTPLLSAL